MRKEILTVVGITILFLGVGIQPAIAVTPDTYDSNDYCVLCLKLSNQKTDKITGDFRPICDILLAWMNSAEKKIEFYGNIYKKIEWLIDIIDIFSPLILIRLFITFNIARLLLPYVLGVLLNCWEHPIILGKN